MLVKVPLHTTKIRTKNGGVISLVGINQDMDLVAEVGGKDGSLIS